MLGGEREIGLVNELPYMPSLGQTAAASFNKPLEQVGQLRDYIFPGASTEEERRKTAERLSVINELTGDPRQGIGQKSLNTVSNIVGGLIPTLPFAVLGGGIGAGVAGAVGFGARKLALEAGSEAITTGYLSTQVPLANLAEGALGHFLPKASGAAITSGIVESYAGYKGVIIPEHFSEHYNAIENSLDASHAIQDWGADNYGFLLAAAPLAAGYVLFKGVRGVIAHRAENASTAALEKETTRLLKQHAETLELNKVKEGEVAAREAKVSELQSHLQQAEEMKLITPEMHQWYLDYLENPNDMTKIHGGGLNILKSLQIPYDRVTGRVWNEVLTRDGIKNLKSSLFDQGITQFSEEESQLLSSYIVHNELDGYIGNMRDNPNLLNAMQGMTHHLGMRIEANSAALKAFDVALDKNISKGLGKNELFSQQSIYEHLKKIGVYERKHVPYEVPNEVMQKLALEKQLKKILSRETLEDEHLFQQGVHHEIKKELEEIKLHTPEQEIRSLKEKLFPKGKLSKKFKNSKAYNRLDELAQVWPNAQVLLDRINMEAINAKQQGLNEILKKFTDMVDNNSQALADPELVKRYLHSRLEKAVPFAKEFEKEGIKIEPATVETKGLEEVTKSESLFNEESKQTVQSSELEFAKNDFEGSEKRFKQFKENEEALNELIKCQLGE
jgi:hypothetical protein